MSPNEGLATMAGATGAPTAPECPQVKAWLLREAVPPPLLDYEEAHDLQLRLVSARASGIIESDILLVMEHAPVLTLGRRGGRENLRVSESFLKEAGIAVVHAERGGDITFHGPGQLVGYPILDLRAAGLTIAGYLERLEEIMIQTAAHWGIIATRSPLNRGIWVGGRKLGSLGIAVRRGIAFHGFALNVNMSLEPFGWINPCGLHGVRMTSIEQEMAQEPEAACRPGGSPAASMKEVREQVKLNFQKVFNVDLDLEIPPSCSMSCTHLLGLG
jgi:lipoate-protein ligase B